MKHTYELRRYTKTTGGIGERILTGDKLKDCLKFLYAAISLNKYTFERDGYTWIIHASPYGKQTKLFRIFKIEVSNDKA